VTSATGDLIRRLRGGLSPQAAAAALPVPRRRAGRLSLNRMPHPLLWEDPDWRTAGRSLGLPQDEGWYHRKAFEWTHCIYGLERLGALGLGTRVLGVGAGHECVLYYLANRSRLTVATDLYRGDFVDSVGGEADPEFLRNPQKFAPFRYHEERLVGLPADGCHLPFRDGSFDVVYSLSSVEHFGGHAKAAQAMADMGRVLRRGGVCCVATELVLAGGPHPEYFTLEELDEWLIRPSGLVPVEELDPELPPREYLDDPVWLPDQVLRTPHLVLAMGELRWTSVILFLRKPSNVRLAEGVARRIGRAGRRRLRHRPSS
jgi:SAM-dependent methyltransferase